MRKQAMHASMHACMYGESDSKHAKGLRRTGKLSRRAAAHDPAS